MAHSPEVCTVPFICPSLLGDIPPPSPTQSPEMEAKREIQEGGLRPSPWEK